MRVAIRKSDGFIIEGQSNDAASFVSLKRNAKEAGYKDEDVEYKIMADADFAARLRAQNDALPKPKSRLDLIEERLTAVENVVTGKRR